MKLLKTLVALTLAIPLGSALADVNWFTLPTSQDGALPGPAGGLWDEGGVGGTLLTGHNGDSSVGFFVQLFEDVAKDNGALNPGADAAIAAGNGADVTGDDVVV